VRGVGIVEGRVIENGMKPVGGPMTGVDGTDAPGACGAGPLAEIDEPDG
jgi:hypothetical protein